MCFVCYVPPLINYAQVLLNYCLVSMVYTMFKMGAFILCTFYFVILD